MSTRTVVGVDVWKGQWVAVVLNGGEYVSAKVFPSLAALVRDNSQANVIGIDVPIGLPALGHKRDADVEARLHIGIRRQSVFMTASEAELGAESYEAAVAIAHNAKHPAMSRQLWGLRSSIYEVARVAAGDGRIREVHPEVSFAEMAGETLPWPKASWNGSHMRRDLLRHVSIELPDEIMEVQMAGIADVLDAAAAAWSADRIAQGIAYSLPDPPEQLSGTAAAIWV
jgi:predicted RNase H-like nuclease